jgi:hypothetical protein
MGEWGFVPCDAREVERWMVRKNTDLRAGDRWLLFVSPPTRQRRGLCI